METEKNIGTKLHRMEIVYKSLWILLVLLDRVYQILCCFKFLIGYLYVNIKFTATHGLNQFRNDVRLLDECKKQLKKIPNHLSIVFGNSDRISSEILSKIAVYALISDIDYISFYDVSGQFKLAQANIPKFVNSQKMQNGRLLWTIPGDRRTSSGLLKYKNGLEKSIEVVALSPENCKPLLASVCKDLCAKKSSAAIRDVIISKNSLTKCISETAQKRLDNLPDPDLVVLFDQTMCTYGFLPWQTGFAEFHHIKTSNCFNVQMFANILCKFSKCEQRFGK